jgi:hypothetical protein
MLRFYGERFRTVEINSTFYGMPKASVLEGWADTVPADFKFVLKAPKQITHLQGLEDAGDLVSHLLEVAGALKEHIRHGSTMRSSVCYAIIVQRCASPMPWGTLKFVSSRPRIGAICACDGPTMAMRN